ncbi:hypothetical protein JOC27_001600 [Sporolactobacillus spathodeae]|uniref:Uncharacterized protein n=1 Tax=Sporolactobacillus spathodeae TaxID=1465502 RepID=A0ABS2Q8N6_9BACL|nr:hypothetical protein [Sporolactobacillus spathodeae]
MVYVKAPGKALKIYRVPLEVVAFAFKFGGETRNIGQELDRKSRVRPKWGKVWPNQ